MKHRKSGRHLNRTRSHLQAMFRNMACSLFRYEQIQTTLIKAKELRTIVDKCITYSKVDNQSRRRLIFSKIRDHEIVNKLFKELGPHFLNRPGGYTRILKCGFRPGDKATLAYIQLVSRNQNSLKIKKNEII